MYNQLKDIREKKNLSKLEVAYLIGTNDISIAKMEVQNADIKLKEAARLAYIYELTLDDIYIAINRKSKLCR